MSLRHVFAPLTRPRVFWACTWRRIKGADAIDWLFAALFLVVGLAIATAVLVIVQPDPVPSFEAIHYVNPTTVVEVTEEFVSFSTVRVADCIAYECPAGEIPLRFETSWAEVNGSGLLVTVSDGSTAMIEGPDYARGEIVSVTLPFETPIPPDVADIGGAWRLKALVTPRVPGGLPTVIVSDPIMLGEGER